MAHPTETATADLLAALVAEFEKKNAEEIELPEPTSVTPFPSIL